MKQPRSAVVFKQTQLTHNSYPSDVDSEYSQGSSAQVGIHRTTADNCDDVALGEENAVSSNKLAVKKQRKG
jgi:hypothetical protein